MKPSIISKEFMMILYRKVKVKTNVLMRSPSVPLLLSGQIDVDKFHIPSQHNRWIED